MNNRGDGDSHLCTFCGQSLKPSPRYFGIDKDKAICYNGYMVKIRRYLKKSRTPGKYPSTGSLLLTMIDLGFFLSGGYNGKA